MSRPRPPRIPERILRLLVPDDLGPFAPGDFEEIFNRLGRQRGFLRARIWYWTQVARSLPALIADLIFRRILMLKSTLRSLIHHILRHKGFTAINLTGLAVGMAACILAFLYIQDELSFDRFHPRDKQTHRVIRHTLQGGQESFEPSAPAPLAGVLRDGIPEMEAAGAVLLTEGWVIRIGDRMFNQDKIAWIEPQILEMLRFEFLLGRRESALADPDGMVLTESLGRRLFGDRNPMGQILHFNRSDVRVTGLIRDLPANSHLQVDALVPLTAWRSDLDRWDWNSCHIYIRLSEAASLPEVTERMNRYWKHRTDGQAGRVELQPLRSIHLDSGHLRWDYALRGDRKILTLLATLAGFLLIIACVNFISLSTARSATRAVEVGVRKVSGAHRSDIIRQFLTESLLTALFALFIGLALVHLALPVFNRLVQKSLEFQPLRDPLLLATLIGIALLSGAVSGIYPALFYSAFHPVDILKRRSGFSRKSLFRNGLVIFQFVVSILLIFGTLIIHRQLGFMRHKDLGFDKDNLVVMMALGGFYSNYPALKTEMLQNPHILGVAKGFQPVWNEINTTSPDWEGRPEGAEFAVQNFSVDFDYFKTYGMELAGGRFFSPDFPTDRENFLLNETAVRVLAIDSPLEKRFAIDDREGRIVGIVKDFHHGPLHHSIQPVVFSMGEGIAALNIRTRPGYTAEALDYLRDVWKRVVPNRPFEYHFLNARLEEFYSREIRLELIFRRFTELSIFIACLGLFGLACFSAERRTKEIGIRKVLGASSGRIMRMLTGDFLKLVLLAMAIAWPLGWVLLGHWLRGFAYRTEIGIEPFLLSGAIALIVSLLTVNLQSLRAAAANPADSLRSE